MKNEFMLFSQGFQKGYDYVLYDSEPENREVPKVSYNDFYSLGYKKGFEYAEYCELTFQTMSISREQLIAIIDKAFTRTISEQEEYQARENRYVVYKSGFVSGKGDVLLKYHEKDETFNLIPDFDSNDINSIGYYDGYCHYLREILNVQGLEDVESLPKLDEVCRDSFNASYEVYNFANIESKESVK